MGTGAYRSAAKAASHRATTPKYQRNSNYQRNLLALTGVTYDEFGMAFQALLFCPDDKTSRTVTQVLSELEFTVEACTEPFAAVKKLMGQHFDAIVVDCDNEQNATLLFKSARNSTSNQASLAVAIVEGQAGVAKAFRIGANLVLTKPINVEQSKGTLRVARGLLRKGDPIKPATAAPPEALSAPAKPVAIPAPVLPAKPAAARSSLPSRPAPIVPTLPPRPVVTALAKPVTNVAAAQAAASSGLAEPEEILQLNEAKSGSPTATLPATTVPVSAPARPAPSPGLRVPFMGAPEGPAGSFSAAGAASAPAPAREIQISNAVAATAPRAPHRAADLFKRSPALSAPASPSSTAEAVVRSTQSVAAAPSFTFGGANAPEASGTGNKKILLGIAAVVVVAALGYVGSSHLSGGPKRTAGPTPSPVSTTLAAPTNLPAPQKPAPSATATNMQPLSEPVVTASSTATTSDDASAAPESSPAEIRLVTKPTQTPSSSVSKSPPSAKSEDAPLVVKGGAAPAIHTNPAPADTPAPNVMAVATPGSGGSLDNLVGHNTNAFKPVLQTVSISQGVSQGLLMKKVQPVYPRTALAMHVEGVVELMATISKTGEISTVSVLKGDPQLIHAAIDAVKQWKYKPYLLNGEPVEIQTQVTISFKLPH
jgi:periplasmic protein TonB